MNKETALQNIKHIATSRGDIRQKISYLIKIRNETKDPDIEDECNKYLSQLADLKWQGKNMVESRNMVGGKNMVEAKESDRYQAIRYSRYLYAVMDTEKHLLAKKPEYINNPEAEKYGYDKDGKAIFFTSKNKEEAQAYADKLNSGLTESSNNQLQQMNRWAKKRQKGLSPFGNFKRNAGDVEKGVEMFNNATTFNTTGAGQGIGENMEDINKYKNIIKRWAKQDFNYGKLMDSYDDEVFKKILIDNYPQLKSENDTFFNNLWHYYWECVDDAKSNKLDESTLTEKNWKKKVPNDIAKAFRSAINQEQDTMADVINATNTLLDWILKEYPDEDYEIEDIKSDLNLINPNEAPDDMFADDMENDDWEDNDTNEDQFNFVLSEIYDLCDSLDIWIPTEGMMDESFNEDYNSDLKRFLNKYKGAKVKFLGFDYDDFYNIEDEEDLEDVAFFKSFEGKIGEIDGCAISDGFESYKSDKENFEDCYWDLTIDGKELEGISGLNLKLINLKESFEDEHLGGKDYIKSSNDNFEKDKENERQVKLELAKKGIVKESKEDYYTIEINNNILTDEDGNTIKFDSYEDAEKYKKYKKLDKAEITRQDKRNFNESKQINIVECLNNLDKEDYRDLLNLYNSIKPTLADKKYIAEKLANNDEKEVERFLNEKFTKEYKFNFNKRK